MNASGFTVAGGESGSRVNSLIDLQVFASQHGMIWVPLNLLPVNSKTDTDDSTFLNINAKEKTVGVQAPTDGDHSAIDPAELETSKFLDPRVAKFAKAYAPIANEF